MDTNTAVRVAEALGLRISTSDLLPPKMVERVFVILDERDKLRAELAEVREELSGLRGMMHDADSAFQQYLTCRDQYETALSAWNEEIELRKKVEAELAAAKAEVARLRRTRRIEEWQKGEQP